MRYNLSRQRDIQPEEHFRGEGCWDSRMGTACMSARTSGLVTPQSVAPPIAPPINDAVQAPELTSQVFLLVAKASANEDRYPQPVIRTAVLRQLVVCDRASEALSGVQRKLKMVQHAWTMTFPHMLFFILTNCGYIHMALADTSNFHSRTMRYLVFESTIPSISVDEDSLFTYNCDPEVFLMVRGFGQVSATSSLIRTVGLPPNI